MSPLRLPGRVRSSDKRTAARGTVTDRHPATTTVGDQLVARRTRAAAHRRERISAHPCRTDRRRRRRDGHDVAGRRPGARRLRGPRRLQRDPQRHPARRGARHPPRLLRGGRGRRRDEHVRREPAQPRRVRHPGPDPRARREGHGAGPRGGRRAVAHRTSRASCSARSAPARSCRRWATRPSPASATPTPSAAAAWSRAGPTRSSSRPARTSCRPRRPSWACAGRWTPKAAGCRSWRRSPSRPPARCCSAPRSAPRSPRWKRSASTSSG